MIRVFISALLLFSSFTAFAQNQTRCQCEFDDLLGDCSASVVLRGDKFTIKTNTKQCSRVDWYRGSSPETTIVTDGMEKKTWLSYPKDPGELVVDDCRVCKDSFVGGKNKMTSGGYRTCPSGYKLTARDGSACMACNKVAQSGIRKCFNDCMAEQAKINGVCKNIQCLENANPSTMPRIEQECGGIIDPQKFQVCIEKISAEATTIARRRHKECRKLDIEATIQNP